VTHAQRGGAYLFLPEFSSLYDAIHGWMESFTKNDHRVLYYMYNNNFETMHFGTNAEEGGFNLKPVLGSY
jgi:hypothetical protein